MCGCQDFLLVGGTPLQTFWERNIYCPSNKRFYCSLKLGPNQPNSFAKPWVSLNYELKWKPICTSYSENYEFSSSNIVIYMYICASVITVSQHAIDNHICNLIKDGYYYWAMSKMLIWNVSIHHNKNTLCMLCYYI